MPSTHVASSRMCIQKSEVVRQRHNQMTPPSDFQIYIFLEWTRFAPRRAQFRPHIPVPTGVAFPQHLPDLLCKQINSKVLVLLGSTALDRTHDSDSLSAVSTASV